MLAYTIRRFITLLLGLFFVSIAVFLVLKVVPGDPAQIILGINATPEALQAVREKLGLNKPLHIQYLNWLAGIFRGDFGTSITYKMSISKLLQSRLMVSLPLTLLAITITIVISIPLGIFAATHHRTIADYGTIIISQIGISIPAFWAGILLLMVFAVFFNWFPAGGFTQWSEGILNALKSLLLPALALGIIRAAVITRLTRSTMLDVLERDYIRTARSKGLSEKLVVYKHALRNSLISVVTILGLQIGQTLAGAIVIENVFHLPGLGRLLLLAIRQRDLEVVQGLVLILAGIITFINFAVDLTYGYLDPRIRYE